MKLKTLRNTYRYSQTTVNPPSIDFLSLKKNNWRTSFQLNSCCVICGSKEKIEMHHIRHLKKIQGKYFGFNGFDKLIGALGRKQAPVCKICHNKIHSGKYNGIKLSEIIDFRLITPESYLKSQSNNPTIPQKTMLPIEKRHNNRRNK